MHFKNISVKTFRILASQRNLGPLSNGDILTRVSISVDVEIFCCYVMLTFSEQINKKIGYQHLKPQGKGVGVGNFQSCYIPATYFFIRLKKRRTIFQFKFMLPFFLHEQERLIFTKLLLWIKIITMSFFAQKVLYIHVHMNHGISKNGYTI